MPDTPEIDILLVEDNPNDAELTQRAFRKSELDVRLAIARDGAEALEYLFGGRPLPKVVLLNLKLPKIDGIVSTRNSVISDPLPKPTAFTAYRAMKPTIVPIASW